MTADHNDRSPAAATELEYLKATEGAINERTLSRGDRQCLTLNTCKFADNVDQRPPIFFEFVRAFARLIVGVNG